MAYDCGFIRFVFFLSLFPQTHNSRFRCGLVASHWAWHVLLSKSIRWMEQKPTAIISSSQDKMLLIFTSKNVHTERRGERSNFTLRVKFMLSPNASREYIFVCFSINFLIYSIPVEMIRLQSLARNRMSRHGLYTGKGVMVSGWFTSYMVHTFAVPERHLLCDNSAMATPSRLWDVGWSALMYKPFSLTWRLDKAPVKWQDLTTCVGGLLRSTVLS